MGYFFKIIYLVVMICESLFTLLLSLFGYKGYLLPSDNLLLTYHANRVSKEIRERNQEKDTKAKIAMETIRSEIDKNG